MVRSYLALLVVVGRWLDGDTGVVVGGLDEEAPGVWGGLDEESPVRLRGVSEETPVNLRVLDEETPVNSRGLDGETPVIPLKNEGICVFFLVSLMILSRDICLVWWGAAAAWATMAAPVRTRLAWRGCWVRWRWMASRMRARAMSWALVRGSLGVFMMSPLLG